MCVWFTVYVFGNAYVCGFVCGFTCVCVDEEKRRFDVTHRISPSSVSTWQFIYNSSCDDSQRCNISQFILFMQILRFQKYFSHIQPSGKIALTVRRSCQVLMSGGGGGGGVARPGCHVGLGVYPSCCSDGREQWNSLKEMDYSSSFLPSLE